MRTNFKLILSALALTMLSACESERTLPDGKVHQCVGIADDEAREPNINYNLSAQNIAVGVIFAEMIAPPIVVLVNETFCPVSLKPDTSKKTK